MFPGFLACEKGLADVFSCVLLVVGASAVAEETRLEGFVFQTPVECAEQDGEECSMVSFQIYGAAVAMIFDGMTSEISEEPDICMDWHYKRDEQSGLICYLADDRSDGLCTFGYEFAAQKVRQWAGSC